MFARRFAQTLGLALVLFFWAGLQPAPSELCAQNTVEPRYDLQGRRMWQWEQDEKRIREIQAEQDSTNKFQGYERFDADKSGEVASEWEFFDDPRTSKKKQP